MTTLHRLGVAFGLALALTPVLGGIALAEHLRVLSEVTVTPSEKPAQGYVLAVRLRTSDGRPLNDATVRFYEAVELFGTREMLIATARTDGQGGATTTYLPARAGRHEIVMRFAGRDHVAPAEHRSAFEATVAAPPYRTRTPPLASFTAVVPYGAGVVVLFVWALIGFAFFGTARGVLRGARDHPQKGDTA